MPIKSLLGSLKWTPIAFRHLKIGSMDGKLEKEQCRILPLKEKERE